jgi:hypothetical protein
MPPTRRLQRRIQSFAILGVLLFLIYTASNVISGESSIRFSSSSPNGKIVESDWVPEEKELVVASMYSDDVGWLDEFFGDWKRNVYVVNNASAPLTVPRNKGREAMPFLTYAKTQFA